MQQAKRQLTYLLIYLHSSSHPDALPFVHTILGNPELKGYLESNVSEYTFWVGDVSSPDGYEAMRLLDVDTFPSLVVCQCPAVQLRRPVIGKWERIKEISILIQGLEEVKRVYGSSLVTLRLQRYVPCFLSMCIRTPCGIPLVPAW